MPKPARSRFRSPCDIDAPIVKTSQQALQALGLTPIVVVGETYLTHSQADKRLTLHALVVEDLDVDVLVGTPFISNDILFRPTKGQVLIEGSEVDSYHSETLTSPHAHAIRRAQSYVLRLTTSTTFVLSSENLEIHVPPDLGSGSILATETRTDAPSNKCC